jgi:Ala-tRNA(Pro) deacylase
MAIAMTLKEYLDRLGVEYEVIPHIHTDTSMRSAQEAHVPGDHLAKSVILEDDGGYLMAVLPATHKLEIGRLQKQLNRHRLGLATEQELSSLFDDCEMGAIPPLGEAYGVDVVVDDSLDEMSDVYFEAGDHTDLVHISGEDFHDLMVDAEHGRFSHHI